MQREVEIERRSRLLSVAADDAAARGAGGCSCDVPLSPRRSVQSGTSGEYCARVSRCVRSGRLRRADRGAHGSGVFTNLDGSLALPAAVPRFPPMGPGAAKGAGDSCP